MNRLPSLGVAPLPDHRRDRRCPDVLQRCLDRSIDALGHLGVVVVLVGKGLVLVGLVEKSIVGSRLRGQLELPVSLGSSRFSGGLLGRLAVIDHLDLLD